MTHPSRLWTRLTLLALALVAYVPVVLTQPGWVGADTKHYLYLDPWQLMRRAASVWDPSIGLGTVSHQNIGYLWPMGPWYALFDLIGAPDWLAQRLWLATIFFAAGAGVVVLLRLLGLHGTGAAVAAFAYQLTPYLLTYAARITAILLPWAGLPWLLAFTILALRRGGWRWPAAIAILVTTIGSINASSLLYAALAAALWVPYAVVVLGEVTWGRAARAVARIALLTGITQIWWLVALVLSGAYGPPVLKTTETFEAVSTSSVTSEIVRSLGNWFFYGTDPIGPWVSAAADYQTEGWLIAASFSVAIAALLGAAVTQWAHRAYFLALVVLGATIAVAAHPFDDPSPLGALTKVVAESSTFALALRNAQRATPLLCLGMAVMLGCGVHTIGRRVWRGDVLAAVAASSLIALSLPALWTGGLVDPNLRRPEDIPNWNVEAAAALDARGDTTRVLELPGSDFAAFRWGNTIDPLLPGLMERPWASRESAPQGSAGTISLLTAIDRRLQEGVLEPDALARVARLIGAGDLLIRGDLQIERYRTPRPRVLADLMDPIPPGLGSPATYGPAGTNVPSPKLPLVDEITLGLQPDVPELPALSVYPVESPRDIVQVVPSSAPTLVDGDGEGLVDIAEAGVIDGDEILLYGGTVAERPELVTGGAHVVITDTNRKRAQRFTQLRENYGYTEAAGERPLRVDAADARLDLFPAVGDAAHTVSVIRGGVRSIRATGYGNNVTYIPEDRPFKAMDGDPESAWRVGAFERPVGHRLRIELERPRRLSSLVLTQPVTGDRNRWITKIGVSVDGRRVGDFDLLDASRQPAGQRVDFPAVDGQVVELTVLDDSAGRRASYLGLSAVGLAEVAIDGISAEEWIRPPRTLLESVDDLARHPLTYVLTRLRANEREPIRDDPEPRMARLVDVGAAPRAFEVRGAARISAEADDSLIDRLLGVPGPDAGGISVRSSTFLPGSLESRGSSAFDGDPQTMWTNAFLAQGPQYLDVELPAEAAVDRLDLQLVTDGRHSIPEVLQLESEGGVRTIVLPETPEVTPTGRTPATVTFEPLRGKRFRLVVAEVKPQTTIDYYTRGPIQLPLAIAEVGMPGVRRGAPSAAIATGCRSDLVAIDGQPFPVAIVGDIDRAVERRSLELTGCGRAELAAGEHRITTADGRETGIDVDRVVLTAPPAGGGATAVDDIPNTDVEWARTSRSSHRVDVRDVDEPSWLVLGESWSAGWSATSGTGRDLGEPVLVNGYANGWLLDPDDETGGAGTYELRWRPQRAVNAAIVVSALGAAACVVLVVIGGRREHHVVAAQLADDEPAWPRAFDDGPGLRAPVVTAAALVVGAGAAFVASPLLGVATAMLAAAALASRVGRLLTMSVAIGAATACAAGTFVIQMRHGYQPGFGWAENFDRLHPVGWLVFLALAVEVVRVLLRRIDANRRESRDRGTRRPEDG